MADKRADISPTIRIIAFFSIVAVATFGLAIVYRSLPTHDPVPGRASSVNTQATPHAPVPLDPDRATCERGGGLWTECGDPCRGSTSGTVCTAVCERQCVCGGTKGWTCGEGRVCGRQAMVPGLGMVGVCQRTQVDSTAYGVPTSTAATTTVAATATTTAMAASTQTIDASLLPRAICGEDQSFCLLRAKGWKDSTFTWPLKLQGTAFLDERFTRIRWDFYPIQGDTRLSDELTFTRSTSTPTQISWSLTIPRPASEAFLGTKRARLTFSPGDSSGDFTYIHAPASFEFYIK